MDSLKRFIEVCVQHQAFTMGQEEEEIVAFWKAAHQKALLDELWLHKLLSSAHLEAMAPATGATAGPDPASPPRAALIASASVVVFPRIDWIGALDVSTFTGREVELAELFRWILQEQCRLVAVLGMGGIGKSSLVSMLGHQLAGNFEAVLWRSVRDAPSCEELLADCITFCSETPPAEFPASLERRIDQLSPDGRTAASCGEDGVIKLWDMQSRQHLSTMRSNRLYERLTITGVTGLTEAQKVTLRTLGAVE